jgi:tRNA 5-methylaminomethyl-2-thiouridine biosynthesis bifunctional protein
MKRDNTPWQPVLPAVVRWSDTGTPHSPAFDDIYYSSENGLEESRHVFLAGNHLPDRWRHHPRAHFCVGETGFGTGLNFLLTWQAWRELPDSRPDLHFMSFEHQPLTLADLTQALALWPGLQPLAQQLLDAYPGLLKGQHRLLLDDGRVRLDLWWENAQDALLDLASRQQRLVDAWYLDGFAPARNASMWSAELLQNIAVLSHTDASFATFTAAGQVRRDLSAAGFDVHKMSGFGRKRECLRGTIGEQRRNWPLPHTTPWDLPTAEPTRPASALVIGGGLAGCSVAAALARRGISVTVLEQGLLASAGSGNDQGILYTRLSRRHSALVDFALQSFRFAAMFYRNMFRSGMLTKGVDGDLCGTFQQSSNTREMSELLQPLQSMGQLAQVLDARQASELLGIDQPSAGYWYPESGWLRPAAICQALVNRDNIQVIENCGELTLNRTEGQWHAVCGDKTVASAGYVVVAAGCGTVSLEQLNWLPLQTIRGQTTDLPGADTFAGLRATLCHEGYIAPARHGSHCIGATFDVNAAEDLVRSSDHRTNLDGLANAIPAWRQALDSVDAETLSGRVGFRCASPDYLPTVGPVPDMAAFPVAFERLRKDARETINTRGPYLPGLYLSSAHGSRGLTSTPVAAELLASMMCGEPLPFNREMCRALSPSRFIIRGLSRNRL